MSNAGRPPIPTWLKQLRGTAPAGGELDEPRPEDALYFPPPQDLIADHPIAAEFWRVHLPLMVKAKMLAEVDMTGFALMCVCFEEMLEADRELKENGKVITTENGYKVQSPYVTIAAQRRKEFLEYLREFGLTPSARTRIKIQLIPAGGREAAAARDESQLFFDY